MLEPVEDDDRARLERFDDLLRLKIKNKILRLRAFPALERGRQVP